VKPVKVARLGFHIRERSTDINVDAEGQTFSGYARYTIGWGGLMNLRTPTTSTRSGRHPDAGHSVTGRVTWRIEDLRLEPSRSDVRADLDIEVDSVLRGGTPSGTMSPRGQVTCTTTMTSLFGRYYTANVVCSTWLDRAISRKSTADKEGEMSRFSKVAVPALMVLLVVSLAVRPRNHARGADR
jgi:hypothetical protein